MSLLRLVHLLPILALALVLAAPLAAGEAPPPEGEEPLPELPERYVKWLARVELILTDEERAYFLSLEEDFRRNAFIDAFWAERDTYEDTRMNEFRVHYEERNEEALQLFKTLEDERAGFLIRHGEPFEVCLHRMDEVEIWIYDEAPEDEQGVFRLNKADTLFPVLFYARKTNGTYKRWMPEMIYFPARREKPTHNVPIRELCDDSDVALAKKATVARMWNDPMHPEPRTYRSLEMPEPSREWVSAFAAQTTDLPEDAPTFDAEVGFQFLGRHQQRTVVQGVLSFDRADVEAFEAEGVAPEARPTTIVAAHHQFLLLGELVRDDQIFDAFRYRFELPVGQDADERMGLVFQRYLRPGSFRLLLKLEDLFGRRYAHFDRPLEVPNVDKPAPAELLGMALEDSEIFRALAEADAATAKGERSLRLLSPPGVVHTGYIRFKTITVGEYSRLEFLLDDQPIFTKRQPPYSVDLDLGDVPEAHRLRVDGYDEEGERVATDELLLNPGGQRFRVHLTEPQSGRDYRQSLRAAVQVIVPDGEAVERVELYLNEDRIATLYQPPYTQPVLLRGDALAYVRAVAYLEDGNASEDLVFINAPGEIDEIQVHFVELYATVHDKQGRLIPGLGESDFQVLEDGEPQTARRFEWVENLPLTAALFIDVSASMEEDLEKVGEAALSFVEDVITPRDRVSLISFNHQPRVAARFTNDVAAVSRELKALRASGSTALYDSLAFALHYFNGIRGQKVLLLLSDGKDESSTFEFDSALKFAQRAGVMIYAIGLREAAELKKRGVRKILEKLARETGGEAFFVESDLAELDGIYATIQQELRSQYLFAYQSSSTEDPSEFRRVEVVVEVDGKKVEVRTMSGYYP